MKRFFFFNLKRNIIWPCKTEKETQMYITDFWTLWKKARVGWSERTASKHVYYQVWNRSPVQVGCIKQVLGAGALGWLRGMGWGTYVNPWLIHVNVWQQPLQYCKEVSLQLIKIKKNLKNQKKKKRITMRGRICLLFHVKLNQVEQGNSH